MEKQTHQLHPCLHDRGLSLSSSEYRGNKIYCIRQITYGSITLASGEALTSWNGETSGVMHHVLYNFCMAGRMLKISPLHSTKMSTLCVYFGRSKMKVRNGNFLSTGIRSDQIISLMVD